MFFVKEGRLQNPPFKMTFVLLSATDNDVIYLSDSDADKKSAALLLTFEKRAIWHFLILFSFH